VEEPFMEIDDKGGEISHKDKKGEENMINEK
jgi:hypothetical protein